MKNTILATIALVALTMTSFAKEKDFDAKLFNDLSATFKNSTQLHWTTKAQYRQAVFSFRNKSAAAYYTADGDELIGFRIQLNKSELPTVVSDAMKNKYSDWEVVDAIIFVDASGYVNYFIQVKKDKKSLVLKISPGGKLSTYARMHS